MAKKEILEILHRDEDKITVRFRGKVFVVSGCPRSGTSVCMDILRNMFGDVMIMGYNLLGEDKTDEEIEDEIAKQKQEILDNIKHDGLRTVEAYMMERNEKRFPKHKENQKKQREQRKESRDMNPKGFWEDTRFSVRGIQRVMTNRRGQIVQIFDEECKEMLTTPKILKVVSQGLIASDPVYIDKVLFMLRHPRAVAKSQERLRGGLPKEDGDSITLPGKSPEDIVIHSPRMFISVSMQALQFFKQNPDIPVKIIQYEDLMTDPNNVIETIYNFTGFKGDLEAGKSVVEKKLNRSEHQDTPCTLWAESEYVHDVLCQLQVLFDAGNNREAIEKLIDETIEYMTQPEREINILQQQWFCFRAKMRVSATICKDCMLNPFTVENYRKQSEGKLQEGVRKWPDEPCLFECGMDVKRKKHITTRQSALLNWWKVPGPYPLEDARAGKSLNKFV